MNAIKEEEDEDDEIYTDPELKEDNYRDNGETSELPSPIKNLSSQLNLDG